MNSPQSGFYRLPSISGDSVVFASGDDLWTAPLGGGTARRLSAGMGQASRSAISRDGKWLAFNSTEEGHSEIYLMPAEGGAIRRVTYIGGTTRLIGWTVDGKILFSSNYRQPYAHLFYVYAVSTEGGEPELLPVGPAVSISFGQNDKACVIGRTATKEPTIWKRYRGGTAGNLWIDPKGDGIFKPLIKLQGNLVDPMWIGRRIYFLSDHEGVGNIYSVTPEGHELTRHTDHEDFYVRQPFSDGKRIVYNSGSELYLLQPETNSKPSRIAIKFHGSRAQTQRKFADPRAYLEEYAIHPLGHMLGVVTRGKAFTFGNWEGPVSSVGHSDSARYRLLNWLSDEKRLVCVSDAQGEERLEIFSCDPSGLNTLSETLSIEFGRALEIKASPTQDQIALVNHRNQIFWIDLQSKAFKKIDQSESGPIAGFNWSHDGKWIAYGLPLSYQTTVIKAFNIQNSETRALTSPLLKDHSPAFDPDGKFVYFLSDRFLDPVYDAAHFDLGFPKIAKPCLVTLQKDVTSPFVPTLKAPEKTELPEKKASEQTKTDVEIDFDGIFDRVLAFPVPEAIYEQIDAVSGKVFFTSTQPAGTLNEVWQSPEVPAHATLEAYDFENQRAETWISEMSHFKISQDRGALAYRKANELRVIKTAQKPEPAPESKAKSPGFDRKNGYIDIQRIKLSVVPLLEWRQMYREVWRLQRDHFWTEDMSKINWTKVYDHYLPLLEKVSSRSEYADVVMEMQGELGTSHAYEMGGDYRAEPRYLLGFLGADIEYDSKLKLYRIRRIVKGDSWVEDKSSPLALPGLEVRDGDTLLAINGVKLDQSTTPQSLLLHRSKTELILTIGDKNGKSERHIRVKTINDETPARYREWVETNRATVHRESNGKLGYIHIPDMGARGYSEFHRSFLQEVDREGLIVDVRFNGGGHVSPLLLEKLARKRIGYCKSRWFGMEPYPREAPRGPMVALTNEFAGSDGDIFCHSFKLLGLGPLIGKRTWGGVIGIWPRHRLVDGSLTTQPEFSFWFKDVGWSVENYGTDPTIEIEYTPQDYVAKRDPQLERGIQEALELVKAHRETKGLNLPDLNQRPNLEAPKLPVR